MFKRSFLIATAALFAAGCASNGSDQSGQAETHVVDEESGEVRYVCRMEKPIGSNIAKRVCFSVAEREMERENTRNDIEAVRRGRLNEENNQ